MAQTPKESEVTRLITDLKEWDAKRNANPTNGRRADESMMVLCQYLLDHPKLDEKERAKAMKTIQGLNLRPYWNYCREHMLDIGLEF